MRRFLITATVVLLVISLIGVTAGTALAKSGPYLPGDIFFSVQYYAEQQRIRWYGDEAVQAEQYLGLMERRIENLVERTGSSYEMDALGYLDGALDQALRAVIKVPDDESASLQERLLSLIVLSEVAAQRLIIAPTQNPTKVVSFSAKLSTIRALTADSQFVFADLLSSLEGDLTASNFVQMQETPLIEDEQIQNEPISVPFPSDSPAGEHEFYPLVGSHAELECIDCHSDGVYDGTPTWCQACHADDKPTEHFAGDCSNCHTPDNWEDADFDHSVAGSSDCLTCHANSKPAKHYGNQCVACHSTSAWIPAAFNHKAVGAVDCVSCHSNDNPTNHYDGQCSNCHKTDSWQNVSFNHSGQTNCQSCHNADKPSGHYSGQCSSCHNTDNWRNANFNHHGQTDCKSCHSDDRPSGHYSGQCSQCHNTNKWGDATFNHAAQTDCIACHAGDRPGDHSNKQCSQCHNQRDWDDADDDDDGDEGDDDDDEDDDKDEKGTIDPITDGTFAWSRSGFDCSGCHGNSRYPDRPESAKTLASLWRGFREILRMNINV